MSQDHTEPTALVDEHTAAHIARLTWEREAARRAKGSHPGMMRLHDDEPVALLELFRREVGPVPAEGSTQ